MSVFPALFNKQSEKIGKPEQEMPGAMEQIRWRTGSLRMILLIVARFAVAISAENDRCFIEVASGDMGPFEASPVGLAADYATGFIRPKGDEELVLRFFAIKNFLHGYHGKSRSGSIHTWKVFFSKNQDSKFHRSANLLRKYFSY